MYISILERIAEPVAEQPRLLQQEVRPQLRAEGIGIPAWDELTAAEKDQVRTLFEEHIFLVLAPFAVDPSHPSSYISGLSVNLAVLLHNPVMGASQFARMKVPTSLLRFAKLTEGCFVPLEEVISRHLGQLLTDMEVLYHATFRVTRDEDIEAEKDDAENLLYTLEKELLRCEVGRPLVHLEVKGDIDEMILTTITSELNVAPGEAFHLPAPLDLTGPLALEGSRREDLKYPGFLPITHPDLAGVESSSPVGMSKAPKRCDVLVQHPYDSLATSMQWLTEWAAADPAVPAIKQILYHTSGDSPIVDTLIKATQAEKQVLAVMEIKARSGEQNNISWARWLEQVGMHVVYGMIRLRIHCELLLVVREESGGLHHYAHVGAGDYHPKATHSYEDTGLLTANPVITDSAARPFNHLSEITHQTGYRRLLAALHSIRSDLLERIEAEIANHAAGLPSEIRIKVNSIVDGAVIDALYRVSQAGVKVDVWVRDICTIQPGMRGLNENIRVRSILGWFLEHSRICWSEVNGKPNVGVGSVDLMHRSSDRHVGAIVGLSNPEHIACIRDLFERAFDDHTIHWELRDRAQSAHTTDPEDRPLSDLQEELTRFTWGRCHQ